MEVVRGGDDNKRRVIETLIKDMEKRVRAKGHERARLGVSISGRSSRDRAISGNQASSSGNGSSSNSSGSNTILEEEEEEDVMVSKPAATRRSASYSCADRLRTWEDKPPSVASEKQKRSPAIIVAGSPGRRRTSVCYIRPVFSTVTTESIDSHRAESFSTGSEHPVPLTSSRRVSSCSQKSLLATVSSHHREEEAAVEKISSPRVSQISVGRSAERATTLNGSTNAVIGKAMAKASWIPEAVNVNANRRNNANETNNCKDDAGGLRICKVRPRYIRILNTSTNKVENLGGHYLLQECDGKLCTNAIYRFGPCVPVAPLAAVNVWAGCMGICRYQPSTNFVNKEVSSWLDGPKCITNLCKSTNKSQLKEGEGGATTESSNSDCEPLPVDNDVDPCTDPDAETDKSAQQNKKKKDDCKSAKKKDICDSTTESEDAEQKPKNSSRKRLVAIFIDCNKQKQTKAKTIEVDDCPCPCPKEENKAPTDKESLNYDSKEEEDCEDEDNDEYSESERVDSCEDSGESDRCPPCMECKTLESTLVVIESDKKSKKKANECPPDKNDESNGYDRAEQSKEESCSSSNDDLCSSSGTSSSSSDDCPPPPSKKASCPRPDSCAKPPKRGPRAPEPKHKDDPCAKPAKKKKDPCEDPRSKPPKKKSDPAEDLCAQFEKKKDPCPKPAKKNEKCDPCAKFQEKKKKDKPKRKNPCEDPCAKLKKKDPCADPCAKPKKKDPCADPCAKPKNKDPCDDPCAQPAKKKKDLPKKECHPVESEESCQDLRVCPKCPRPKMNAGCAKEQPKKNDCSCCIPPPKGYGQSVVVHHKPQKKLKTLSEDNCNSSCDPSQSQSTSFVCGSSSSSSDDCENELEDLYKPPRKAKRPKCPSLCSSSCPPSPSPSLCVSSCHSTRPSPCPSKCLKSPSYPKPCPPSCQPSKCSVTSTICEPPPRYNSKTTSKASCCESTICEPPPRYNSKTTSKASCCESPSPPKPTCSEPPPKKQASGTSCCREPCGKTPSKGSCGKASSTCEAPKRSASCETKHSGGCATNAAEKNSCGQPTSNCAGKVTKNPPCCDKAAKGGSCGCAGNAAKGGSCIGGRANGATCCGGGNAENGGCCGAGANGTCSADTNKSWFSRLRSQFFLSQGGACAGGGGSGARPPPPKTRSDDCTESRSATKRKDRLYSEDSHNQSCCPRPCSTNEAVHVKEAPRPSRAACRSIGCNSGHPPPSPGTCRDDRMTDATPNSCVTNCPNPCAQPPFGHCPTKNRRESQSANGYPKEDWDERSAAKTAVAAGIAVAAVIGLAGRKL